MARRTFGPPNTRELEQCGAGGLDAPRSQAATRRMRGVSCFSYCAGTSDARQTAHSTRNKLLKSETPPPPFSHCGAQRAGPPQSTQALATRGWVQGAAGLIRYVSVSSPVRAHLNSSNPLRAYCGTRHSTQVLLLVPPGGGLSPVPSLLTPQRSAVSRSQPKEDCRRHGTCGGCHGRTQMYYFGLGAYSSAAVISK